MDTSTDRYKDETTARKGIDSKESQTVVMNGTKSAAAPKHGVLLTIQDAGNSSDMDIIQVFCANQKTAQDLLFAHAAENWKAEWGKLPSRSQCFSMYFYSGSTATPQVMPSGVSRVPTARYEDVTIPFVTAEKAAKAVEKVNKSRGSAHRRNARNTAAAGSQ